MSQRLLKSCILLTLMATTSHLFAGPLGWLRAKRRCQPAVATYSVCPPVPSMETVPRSGYAEALYRYTSCIDEWGNDMGEIGAIGYGEVCPDDAEKNAQDNADEEANSLGCAPQDGRVEYCVPPDGYRHLVSPKARTCGVLGYRVTAFVCCCDGKLVRVVATHLDYCQAKQSARRAASHLASAYHGGCCRTWIECRRVPIADGAVGDR